MIRAVSFLSSLAMLLAMGPAFAGDAPVLTPSGQVMVRGYHSGGKDFSSGGSSNLVRQRARIALKATSASERVSAFVQLQDVRQWGEEWNTLNDFNAQGMDAHQAWASAKLMDELELRIGRQEIAFANHRLVGTVGWTERARSFDAARIIYKRDGWLLDAFASRLTDVSGLTERDPTDDTKPDSDFDVAGLWLKWTQSDSLNVSLIVVEDMHDTSGRMRTTAGVLAAGKAGGGFRYSAEGYYQLGSADGDVSHGGYLAAVDLGFDLDAAMKPKFDVFAEIVSGDDDKADGDKLAFDTLFATNHKFYGEMDFFLNLPANTDERGLIDVGAKAHFTPVAGLGVLATAHQFMAAQARGGDSMYGTELELKLITKPLKNLGVNVLFAAMLPGDIFKAKGDSVELFAYATFNSKF